MEPTNDPHFPIVSDGTYSNVLLPINNPPSIHHDASISSVDGSINIDLMRSNTTVFEQAPPVSFLNSIAPPASQAAELSSSAGAKRISRAPKRSASDFVLDDEALAELCEYGDHVKKKARGTAQKKSVPQKTSLSETSVSADIVTKSIAADESTHQHQTSIATTEDGVVKAGQDAISAKDGVAPAVVSEVTKKGLPKGKKRPKKDPEAAAAADAVGTTKLQPESKDLAQDLMRGFPTPLILSDTSRDDKILREKLDTKYFSPFRRNDQHFGVVVEPKGKKENSVSSNKHNMSSSSSSSSGLMQLLQSEVPSLGGGAFNLRDVPFVPSTFEQFSLISQELETNTSQFPNPILLPHQYTLPAETRPEPPTHAYSHLVPTVNRLRAEILPLHALPRAKLFESLSSRIAATAPLHVIAPDCELGDRDKDLLRMAWPKTEAEVPESIPSIGNVWRFCVKTSDQRKRSPWWQLAERASGLEQLEEAVTRKTEADLKAAKIAEREAMIAAYAAAGINPPANAADLSRAKGITDEIIAPKSKSKGVDDTTYAVRHYFSTLLAAEHEAANAAVAPTNSCTSSSSSLSSYEPIVPFVVDSGEEGESRWLLDVLNGRAAATKVLVRNVQRDLEFNDFMYEAKLRKRNLKKLKEILITESHRRRAGLAHRAVHDLSMQRKARGEAPIKRVVKPALPKKTGRQLAKEAAMAAAEEKRAVALSLSAAGASGSSSLSSAVSETSDLLAPKTESSSINAPSDSPASSSSAVIIDVEPPRAQELEGEVTNSDERLKSSLEVLEKGAKATLDVLTLAQEHPHMNANDDVVSVSNGGENNHEMDVSFAEQEDVINKGEPTETISDSNDIEDEDMTKAQLPATVASVVEAASVVQGEEPPVAKAVAAKAAPSNRRRGTAATAGEERVFSEQYMKFKAEFFESEAAAKANVAAAELAFDTAVEDAARKKLEHRKLAAADRIILNAYQLSLGLTRPLSLAMPGPLLRLALVSHRCEVAIAKATEQEELQSLSLVGGAIISSSTAIQNQQPVEEGNGEVVASVAQTGVVEGKEGEQQLLPPSESSSSSSSSSLVRKIRKVGNRWKGLTQPSEGWVFQF